MLENQNCCSSSTLDTSTDHFYEASLLVNFQQSSSFSAKAADISSLSSCCWDPVAVPTGNSSQASFTSNLGEDQTTPPVGEDGLPLLLSAQTSQYSIHQLSNHCVEEEERKTRSFDERIKIRSTLHHPVSKDEIDVPLALTSPRRRKRTEAAASRERRDSIVETEQDEFYQEDMDDQEQQFGDGSDKKAKLALSCTYPGCLASFAHRWHLDRHIRKHTQEKPFLCPAPNCDRRFSRSDNMRQHYRTHGLGKLTGKVAKRLSLESVSTDNLTSTEHQIAGLLSLRLSSGDLQCQDVGQDSDDVSACLMALGARQRFSDSGLQTAHTTHLLLAANDSLSAPVTPQSNKYPGQHAGFKRSIEDDLVIDV